MDYSFWIGFVLAAVAGVLYVVYLPKNKTLMTTAQAKAKDADAFWETIYWTLRFFAYIAIAGYAGVVICAWRILLILFEDVKPLWRFILGVLLTAGFVILPTVAGLKFMDCFVAGALGATLIGTIMLGETDNEKRLYVGEIVAQIGLCFISFEVGLYVDIAVTVCLIVWSLVVWNRKHEKTGKKSRKRVRKVARE